MPGRCEELVTGAEAVVHVGDFTAIEVLGQIKALCPRVHGVHGNVDEPAIRGRLPETLEVSLHGGRLGLIHDAGAARGG